MNEMKKRSQRPSIWRTLGVPMGVVSVILTIVVISQTGGRAQMVAEESEVGIIYLVPCEKCEGNHAWLVTDWNHALKLAKENGIDKAEIRRCSHGELIEFPCKTITFRSTQ